MLQHEVKQKLALLSTEYHVLRSVQPTTKQNTQYLASTCQNEIKAGRKGRKKVLGM